MVHGSGSILWNSPPFGLNARNIPKNIVSPAEHCYGSE